MELHELIGEWLRGNDLHCYVETVAAENGARIIMTNCDRPYAIAHIGDREVYFYPWPMCGLRAKLAAADPDFFSELHKVIRQKHDYLCDHKLEAKC